MPTPPLRTVRTVPSDDPPSRLVEVVRWPAQHDRRVELAAAGHPRLLLVEPGVAPPEVWGVIEDWIRLPAEAGDIALRLAHLSAVAGCPSGRSPSADVVVRR